ncbi:hypothetical protein HYN86_11260 [Flavobacterium fluviale]|uniref:Uncharacterized protein n=1 Tax=Flavobacterium fluviale TaxID=2249356 RepID=A0A344LTA0_9FLAO|nr:hypothetical protein HYN86_11260 [Flavobacterium fluviale]
MKVSLNNKLKRLFCDYTSNKGEKSFLNSYIFFLFLRLINLYSIDYLLYFVGKILFLYYKLIMFELKNNYKTNNL